MLIKRIDGSTRQLGAPADWDGKDMSCGVLPVMDAETPVGNFMFSAWEPKRNCDGLTLHRAIDQSLP